MKYYVSIFIFVISFNAIFSQTPIEDEIGSWFTLSGDYKVSEKISFSNLINAWDYEIADNFNFILYNLSVNYAVSPKLTTTLAYGYSDIDSGFETNTPHTFENRITEQIGYKHKLLRLPINHRFRVEQRFLSKLDENILHNRLRYSIGTEIALNNTLFLNISNEYISTVQTKKVDGFSENRLYTALGIKISKAVNTQVGYLNRKIRGLDLHRLQLGLFYKIDLRKNKNS